MNTNRLADAQSPYLLQHAENPVDWYTWGVEAFEKARKEDKPIFLSIGYATCHWCHVMAHESFEDPGVAELMNDVFINIKVDREERPDIDNTYMTVCQMLTGSGGWPLTILMTPEKRPFYAATYIPKTGRRGRPGLLELIPRIQTLWQENREKVLGSSEEIVSAFRQTLQPDKGEIPDRRVLEGAYQQYTQQYDSTHGGFGSKPKFPSPHNLMFLLRYWKRTGNEDALEMVTKSLTEMRKGGLFDQLGFGFHRYSTDARWLLPHFEKMLYDQALLVMAYTEAWQATGNPLYQKTVEQTITYLNRDLRDADGAYYSAEDADSDGEEGKFYVWTVDEIRDTLSLADAELFIELYNLEESGNYAEEATGETTGKNIPHLEQPIGDAAEEREMSHEELESRLKEIREQLLTRRGQRNRPLLDDKILADWNGLAIAALAKAGRAFGHNEIINDARRAATFLLSTMLKDGVLYHRYRNGDLAVRGHADDYIFLIWGLLELYESTFDSKLLQQALNLNETLSELFWDEENGAYYFTAEDSEELLGRKKEFYDGAVPSGNSVAMMNLIRLSRLTGNTDLEKQADRIAKAAGNQLKKAPTGFGQLLQALEFKYGQSYEIVIAGKKGDSDTRQLLQTLRERFIPHKVVLLREPEDQVLTKLAPYTKNQTMTDGKATAFVCSDFTCQRPTHDPREMLGQIK